MALDNAGMRRLVGTDDDDDDDAGTGTNISFDDDDNDGIVYSLIGCNNNDDDDDDTTTDDDDPVIPCNWSDETVAMLIGWGKWRPNFSLLIVLVLLLLLILLVLSLLGDSTSMRFSSRIGESLPLTSISLWLIPISPLILLLTIKPVLLLVVLLLSLISSDHILSRLLLLFDADPNRYDNAVVTLWRPRIWLCCSSNVLVARNSNDDDDDDDDD